MVGFDHPNFHQMVREGVLLCKTPYVKYKVKGSISGAYDLSTVTGGRVYRVYVGEGAYNFAQWFVDEAELDQYTPEIEKSLVGVAASKIMAESHDSLTFLAELAKTKEMFVKLVPRLILWARKYPLWVTKFDVKNNIPKSQRNNWLEARYGWRTLLYDIEDLSKALASLGKQRHRFNKSSKLEDNHVDTDTSYSSDLAGTYTREVTTSVRITHIGSVTADIDLPPFSFNPLTTAWELTPYSFVIDWFIDVGKALSALSFIATDASYVASIGYKVVVTKTCSLTSVLKPGYWGVVNHSSFCEATRIWRNPCSVPFVPTFKIRLNTAKVIDLVALLFGIKHTIKMNRSKKTWQL
jgi:hypothetical protein